jgi:hypothetical protein
LHSFIAFENRVLRTIFGPRTDKLTEEWRKLHNEELYVLYCSPNIIQVIKSRRLRWAGHVVHMGREEVHTGFWWGNLREGDHLEDPGIIWEDNIKMDLREVGWEGMDWIDPAEDRDR